VQAVEISAEATKLIRDNAQRNGLKVEATEANAFDFLRAQEQAEARWDLIILDPPSFTRTKGKLNDALRGYKELHLRALKLLNPDGLLATFCCSHHVSKTDFAEIINDATVDAKKTLRQIAIYSQGLDHPVIPTIPETEYLKGGLYELVPGR
jgi:23S rRNA (cytosine1962-C5)-methyltransferase